MPALDNATLSASPAATQVLKDPEPIVPVNEPTTATLPPPLPQIASGELPAVQVPPITDENSSDPLISAVIANFGELGSMGIEYYEASDQSTVLYNPELITESDLQEADKMGTIGQIAQPIGGQPQGGAAPNQPSPLAQAGPPPTQTPAPLQNARINNFNPKQISPVQPNPVMGQLDRRVL
jgi:hypothetical protein